MGWYRRSSAWRGTAWRGMAWQGGSVLPAGRGLACTASLAALPPPPTLQFDGTNCFLRLSQGDVAGVLMVAADNASEARIAAAEIQAAAARQQQPIAEAAARLFAAVAPPPASDAPLGCD